MGVTKKEVAERLGVAKQTVVNYIDRLGLSEHVSRVGKYDVLDDFAVSAIADAIGKSIPERMSAPKEDGITTSDAVIAALNARITDLKESNAVLAGQLESERKAATQERESRAREIDDLRQQLVEANDRAAKLADRIASIAERQQAFASLPWWKRGALAVRLLGSGPDE